MGGGRSYRGWMAATTVGITLSLVFLAVEKHVRLPAKSFFLAPQSALTRAVSTEHPGILLTVDPGLAGIEQFPRTDQTPISRGETSRQTDNSSNLLRRPPEPAASVVLQAPVATDGLAELPLHASNSSVSYLMDAMNAAFDNPMLAVSAQRPADEPPPLGVSVDRLAAIPSPASITGRIPEPKRLLAELAMIQQMIDPRARDLASSPASGYQSYPVATAPIVDVTPAEAQSVNEWVLGTQTLLHRVVMLHGLEHPASVLEIRELASLASQAPAIGDTLTDYRLASHLLRAGYALQRRVAVWQAIQNCLDGTSIALASPQNPEMAREHLAESIAAVQAKLGDTGDAAAWRTYLLIDELDAWSKSPQDIWKVGNQLSQRVLSRLNWQRLSQTQASFLAQPEFRQLAAHLAVWGREPVNYRQLLTELELLEVDPISRVRSSLAASVQVLRLSSESQQQLVASALNDHYRNANTRLSISRDMIERFLPGGTYEVRPVRQRILGADTRGDSAVHTKLAVRLIPNESAWHIDVGVLGDMVSATRSSKGPAVFHNTSTAQITSHRHIRMNPMGYSVSSQPTSVVSQDQLRKMSTDFDGLPVIGDFVRLLVREQFDQKRGLAQRITRRLIADEADTEFDRRLEENLTQAERELQQRIIGPLQRLNLNPMVVAMKTTDRRLTIRYRVANELQMAAHTPRPRAPTDSLMSMQLHQSAINNTIGQIGLSERTWKLPELYQRLGEVFQQTQWKIPEDVPTDITIRFAQTRPVTVELVDGKLKLTLRIAELRQPGRLHIERFMVTSSYVPLADGLTAELIRDGVVEIVSSRDRIPLRLIFAKVFVSRPEIPLISESWSSDKRAEGLAVSQVEIRDGWLAVAISEVGSALAEEVAERSRRWKLE